MEAAVLYFELPTRSVAEAAALYLKLPTRSVVEAVGLYFELPPRLYSLTKMILVIFFSVMCYR